MYKVVASNAFKKSLVKIIRQYPRIEKTFDHVVRTLASGKQLDKKFRDHKLKGQYEGFRDCHIAPDIVLIYTIDDGNLILILSKIGSHSNLF